MLAGMLEPLESPAPADALPDWLLPHQADAVVRARSVLARFGGVLIADGVGLGKTRVGLALAAIERAGGGGAAAFVPAALVPQWRNTCAALGVPLDIHSHAGLVRRAPTLPERCSLLVVDEAHAFRNPRTRRYDALARLAAGRRLALLTATPLNNSPADLVSLVHLFAPHDRFRELGVPDLARALRDGDPAASLALGAIAVCRTRRLVEERFPALRGMFPRRILRPSVVYDLAACFGGDLAPILDAIRAVAPVAGTDPGAALIQLGLLRRLESSRAALRRSLARQRDLLDEIARAAEQGVRIGRADVRGAWAGGEESQLVLWPLLHAATASALPGAVARLRDAVDRALALVDDAASLPDTKAEALERLLDGPLAGARTIVFTEHRDTAMHLLRRLRRGRRAMAIVGDSAWAGTTTLTRREALDAFAPQARKRTRSPLLDADLLIATDVLSEGLDLQDARAVVSYDLPWNPVRVMQRIGRIERLGSPHQTIEALHLVPDGGLRDVASVLRVLRSKLTATTGAIGAEPDPLASLWWIEDGAPTAERLERESWRRVAPFEARERWRAAAGDTRRAATPLLAAALAADGLPAQVGILLALEWRSGMRVPLPFVLTPGAAPRRDAGALGTLAGRALAARATPVDPGAFTSALAGVLPLARACMLDLSASRRSSPQPGPGRRAALALLSHAAADAHLRRADDGALTSGIDLLARDLTAGHDRLLGCLVKECGDPAELARRIREVLERAPAPPGPDLSGTPRLVLVAALVVATECPSD
jgi:superfamily II DNA or RNA helicase